MRILYVDAYDSFANNIVGLLESALGVSVSVRKIDDVDVGSNLESFLLGFTAVVVGPGPGDPRKQADIGFISQLWKLTDTSLIPILGICLGFQSLALAFEGSVKRLRHPRHGLVTQVSHQGTDIFEGVANKFHATQYHSFQVTLGETLSDHPELWHAVESAPMLEPLAWDHDDGQNGPVLQAVKHQTKPFWGVQYHPESICTAPAGAEVVRGWWNKSLEWLSSHNQVLNVPSIVISQQLPSRVLHTNGVPDSNSYRGDELELEQVLGSLIRSGKEIRTLQSLSLPLNNLSVVKMCEGLKISREELILLDSQQANGRFSIIGLVIPRQTLKLTFTIHDHRLTITQQGTKQIEKYFTHLTSIWSLLQRILEINALQAGSKSQTPFCGGLMGYISYEAGLDTVGVYTYPQSPESRVPDLNFALVERSIVIDHVDHLIYVQSILPNDNDWLSESTMVINGITKADLFTEDDKNPPILASAHHGLPSTILGSGLRGKNTRCEILDYFKSGEIQRPAELRYCQKILRCREALRAGDSYELCLTDQTIVAVPENNVLDQPWVLYQHLREVNPAPFGAYVRLGGCTILSSSPERFMKWDRKGAFEMRPIKGTVKKSNDMTYECAKSILDSSKERAENLMIVDLIRHDISGTIGAQNCTVSQLMQVEEYETVYQLVSVIEGTLPKINLELQASSRASGHSRVSGIDVLKAALPPGSMTGAPKKRSCEILNNLEENKPRGIYSGVLGYMDVLGGGDFSVVIRTASRMDDEVIWKGKKCFQEKKQTMSNQDAAGEPEVIKHNLSDGASQKLLPHHVWRIGAGGAVTVQSTDKGEFQEMEAKLESVLMIFQK